MLEKTLNHLSIMNINKVTGELVSSREYVLFWLVAMETSKYFFMTFLIRNMLFRKEETFLLQISHVVFDILLIMLYLQLFFNKDPFRKKPLV